MSLVFDVVMMMCCSQVATWRRRDIRTSDTLEGREI